MTFRGKRLWIVVLAASLVAVAGTVAFSSTLNWRIVIVGRKLAGQIQDLSWSELLTMLKPGSPYYPRELAKTPNPFAVLHNPHVSSADEQAGEKLFAENCAVCHGSHAEGQTAPTLVGRALRNGDSDWSLFRAVTRGIPTRGMPPMPLTEREAWQVVGYLRILQSGDSRLRERAKAPPIDLSAQRIEHADAEPNNWLTYSGTYRSWRHTTLTDIDSSNVSRLTLAWALQLNGAEEYNETTPLVVDGVMYLTTTPSEVVAVDAATGKVLWRHTRAAPSDVRLCCGIVNRGVAVLGSRVFVGTIDGYLLALDAQTGKTAWETKIGDGAHGYSITVAPLAVADKIIVGVAGGEFGIRGYLDAYDAANGARAWRFYTVPEPGQPGSETWSGNAWKTGGGPTWVTGSYDPELGLLYWGVGNPSPDYNGDARPGDNLFTNSVIALHADTGKLAWHFQFTPHDEHDWDANQIPVLVDRDFDGTKRRLLLWANRNGFYYVLDRATGEFLHASPFVKQNWATSIDSHGRPVLAPDAAPAPHGTLTWPGVSGGGNWWSPSYSPLTDLLYVPYAEAPKVFVRSADRGGVEFVAGALYLGSAAGATGDPLGAGIRALNPTTGEIAWDYARRNPRPDIGRIGGALSTAGGLVFFGDIDEFVAVDSKDGRELWRVNLGGQINASPVSFAVDGRQRVAIAAGNSIYVFRL